MKTISGYIFKDILKTQGAIFGVLMLIFMSQTFIRFIGRASRGSIPAELVTQLLGLSIPTMANFMLPLSLFLAVLFSIGSFCSQSEMVTMRAAGYSHRRLLSVILLLTLANMAVNAACTCYLSPLCEARQIEIVNKAKSDPALLSIDSGRFVNLGGGYVVYIENDGSMTREHNIMNQVYILTAGDEKRSPAVTISTSAKTEYDREGLLWLTLYGGTIYEGPDKRKEYKVSHFDEYRAMIPETSAESGTAKASAKSVPELWRSRENPDRAELQWRFVQPLTVLVLVAMVVPLAMVNPRQGRFAKFLPAVLIYISYYLFAFGLKSGIARGHFPEFPGIFAVAAAYLLIFTIPLNLTGTEWYNRLRAGRRGRRAAGGKG